VVNESPECFTRKNGGWSFEFGNPVTGGFVVAYAGPTTRRIPLTTKLTVRWRSNGPLECKTDSGIVCDLPAEEDMKNTNQATHNHKRVGAVIVLQSTEELAEVLVPSSCDHFWVKRTELTKLDDDEDERKSRPHIRSKR
jgi:hypothetical protein